MTKTSIRVVAAVLGGAAVITMGGLGLADGDTVGPSVTTEAKGASMTIGVTSTEAKPASAPVTSMAKPGIKGPAKLPAEEQAAE